MALDTRIEEESPLDGPSEAFGQHHDVINRTSTYGKRIKSKVEGLLIAGHITPEQTAAAKRFTDDYLKGCVGRSKSCLDINPGGGGAGYQSEERHDAALRFEEARVALDGRLSRNTSGATPSRTLLMLCLDDMPMTEIARNIGTDTTEWTARKRVVSLLGRLADHYDVADRHTGSSRTPHTVEAAMRLLDPDRTAEAKADQPSSST